MLSDDELAQLDEMLLSIPMENEGMLLSEFDGFCAGLVVCPEMIMPSEWLSCVWGEGADHFATLEEFQSATDLVMRHYNDVAVSLTPPHIEYGPLFDEDTRTKEILWEFWACGFERAMRLRMDAWEQIIESPDEEARSSVTMMLAIYNIAEGKSDLAKKSVREITKEAPDLIPKLVVTINGWTKSRSIKGGLPPFMQSANTPCAPLSGKKVGRNEPCPCGSGRKYKHCCSAN